MIHYENMIPVEDYLRLRDSVGWKRIAYEQAECAVKNCFYSVCCYDDSTVIGMIRLLWSGDYCAYISDVVVDAPYRGQRKLLRTIWFCQKTEGLFRSGA